MMGRVSVWVIVVGLVTVGSLVGGLVGRRGSPRSPLVTRSVEVVYLQHQKTAGGLCDLAVKTKLSGCGAGVRGEDGLAANRRNKCGFEARQLPSFTTTEKKVTIAYLYYKDGEMFQNVHVRDWEHWPTELLNEIYFLIVDDGSPPGERAIDVVKTTNPSLTLGIATVECDVGWNIHGARNLLFHVAPTDYVLMMDADTGVPVTFASSLFAMMDQATTGLIYRRFQRIQRTCNAVNSAEFLPGDTILDSDHPAAMLLTRSTYWKVGGCDEDFVGAYGSTHFRYRADNTPGVRSIFPTHLPRLIAHTCHGPRRPPTVSQSKLQKKRRRSSTHISNADQANSDLFKAKKHNIIPWSNDYLRFDYSLHSLVVRPSSFNASSSLNASSSVVVTTSSSSSSSFSGDPSSPAHPRHRRRRRHLRRPRLHS